LARQTISSTDLHRNKMPVSTSDVGNNSKPSYCQTSNTAFFKQRRPPAMLGIQIQRTE